jgi:transposase InsO family protein
MSVTVKTAAIARALGLSRKAAPERAKREGRPSVRLSGGIRRVEYRLPTDVRLALAGSPDGTAPDPPPPGQTFLRASEKERSAAAFRGVLIDEWKRSGLHKDDFIAAYNSGDTDRRTFKEPGPVSLRTFYRRINNFSQKGMDGIVPRYGAASGGPGESLSDTEKALLERFRLKDTRPTIRHALRLLRENCPGSGCSYQAARRYLRSLPEALVDYRRLGKTAFTNKHQPYMDQNIWRYKSLDVVVSDHHCLDCVVTYQGKPVRPWVTTMQDYRSGMVLGWCPSVAPSSLSIIAAYYMAVIRYGIPRKLVFDNGKDYRSEILNGKSATAVTRTPEGWDEEKEVFIQGLFSLVGSEVSFTLPYNGKSKGRQERYYGTLKEYFSKEIGSFVGGDTRERPETTELYFRAVNGMAKRNDLPGWEDAVNALGSVIRYINNDLPSTGKGMDGKTAERVFAENLPADVRRADREVLKLALSRGELRRVRNNVVLVNDAKYYHPDLVLYSGQQVMVRSLPVTDEEVMVCDLDGRFLFNARANYFFEGEGPDAAMERLRGAQKRNLLRLAGMGAGEVAAAPEYETMIQVAANKYRQTGPVDIDDYLGRPEETAPLPLAAGAEHQSIHPEPPVPDEPGRVIKNPLYAQPEDYL